MSCVSGCIYPKDKMLILSDGKREDKDREPAAIVIERNGEKICFYRSVKTECCPTDGSTDDYDHCTSCGECPCESSSSSDSSDSSQSGSPSSISDSSLSDSSLSIILSSLSSFLTSSSESSESGDDVPCTCPEGLAASYVISGSYPEVGLMQYTGVYTPCAVTQSTGSWYDGCYGGGEPTSWDGTVTLESSCVWYGYPRGSGSSRCWTWPGSSKVLRSGGNPPAVLWHYSNPDNPCGVCYWLLYIWVANQGGNPNAEIHWIGIKTHGDTPAGTYTAVKSGMVPQTMQVS